MIRGICEGEMTAEIENRNAISSQNFSYPKLLIGLALSTVILAALVMSINPGVKETKQIMLSQALLADKEGARINSEDLAARVVEQKFQVHAQESDQSAGEIPSVEVWVLNDPFYPIIGKVANLRSNKGTLAGKEWQMLGFPKYETGTSGGTSGTSSTNQTSSNSTASVSATSAQKVVLVEEIYETRGIKYGKIKVNDTTYDRLKAGSDFADVFKVLEIKDDQTVVVMCGDEQYELRVGQLRKI
jgi:hypothetical protein